VISSQITNVTDGLTDSLDRQDGRHAIARPHFALPRFALKCIARQ